MALCGGKQRWTMSQRARILLLACCVVCLARPAQAQSVADTAEKIQRAEVTTRILYVTAHPDDESSGILTYLARGLNAEVALVSTTRGEGGQNAIGPEQGPPLAILRTQELLKATRGYGVQLYFTRAPDFGYSKTAEETLRIWDGAVLEDLVRVIRTFRPNVVINQWGGVHTGHGQHQATGILTPQAVEMAADEKAFPEQLKEGLAVWKTNQVLGISRSDAPPAGAWRVPVEEISPLWGKSYADIGRDAFGAHRSQGVTAFLNSPFFRHAIYLTAPAGAVDPAALHQGLQALAADFAGHGAAAQKVLAAANEELNKGRAEALGLDYEQAAASIANAGAQVEALEKKLCRKAAEGTAACLDLADERTKVDAALESAVAINLTARAERQEVVAGETLRVILSWTWRSSVPMRVQKLEVLRPAGWTELADTKQTVKPGGHETAYLVTASNATPPGAPGDAILPEAKPLLEGRLAAKINGYGFVVNVPVEALRATSTSFDELPVELAPAVSLTVEPAQMMLPLARARTGAPVDLLLRVRYHAQAAGKVTVALELPKGWKTSAIEELDFQGPGDRLLPVRVFPPAGIPPGPYALRPFAKLGGSPAVSVTTSATGMPAGMPEGGTPAGMAAGMPEGGRPAAESAANIFRESIEAVPSLPGRGWREPALVIVHVLDLKEPADLRVCYGESAYDLVPETLRHIGIHVTLLDEASLSFGDLGGYDAIVIGIRAYELRGDLLRANPRLLDYVKAGGTLVVQYQRDYVWNKHQLAPFAATMPERTARTTDEDSPVHFFKPASPLLNYPNRITVDDFRGWVQERGLYYWGKFDARYRDVVAFRDPGEEELGGALVFARDGKGMYIYTGLAFFRELPAGVPGAYRLFVNLLSQSRKGKAEGGKDREDGVKP